MRPAYKVPHCTTGVDLGVSAWATLANGEQITMPDTEKHQRRLKRYQRRLAKMTKGSKRFVRQRLKIGRAHRRITGIRSNATHQLTASLVKQWSVIGIENLNVKGMTASAKGTAEAPGKNVKAKAGLNRGILNNNFAELRRQLEYKAPRTGTKVIAIDRWAPSSKTCSRCGSYQESMPLSVREWICPDCGTHHDRDVNAARNINCLAVNTLGARGIDGRGADGSAEASANATSSVEAPTRQRIGRIAPVKRKTVSSGLTATLSSTLVGNALVTPGGVENT